jgi:hypothetical protein
LSIRAVPDRRQGETNPTKEKTMRYVLMTALDESAGLRDPELESDEISPEYAAFMKDAADRGVLLGGERLRLTSDATTVRVRNGETLTTDGPFAETKEQLAGYFIVDCKNLDEAIEVASRIPGAKDGSIEVRPIWEH